MINRAYKYENFELWDVSAWRGRISRVNGIVQYLGERSVLRTDLYRRPELDAETERRLYDAKVGTVKVPEFFKEWEDRGLMVAPRNMTEHWMAAVPSRALPKGEVTLPVLTVVLQGDYDDHYWPMDIAAAYREYLEMAVRDGWIVIFVLSNRRPDVERTYVNILQEAGALYPCDMKRLYLDVGPVISDGRRLADIPCDKLRRPDGTETEDPDELVERVTSLDIPGLKLTGNWEYRGSLGRDLMMEDKYSIGSFPRPAVLHSETGRKLMEGISLEYKYDTIFDPGLIDHFKSMGLELKVHYTNGERWLTLTPISALGDDGVNLPLFCVMQEVYEGNEHLAVTALSYFYELTKIAANGECMLLFFVLEDADSNDLLCRLIDECAEIYPVDKRRVYLTGHSHDGRYTLEFAARHYRKIAAAATLGNFCGLEDSRRLGAAGVTDERMEALSKIELPLANFCGCCEHGGKLPLNVDARTMPLRPGQEFGRTITLEDRLYAWQRRLRAWNCAMRTDEEILAARESPDIVERELGFPVDRSSVRVMDGFRNFIGDLRDKNGRYLLRMVGLEDMPHMPTPAMLCLAWEFVSRFARDLETGATIELY